MDNKTNKFNCFLCGGLFNRIGEPCIHYDDKNKEDGDEYVSLCDNCTEKTLNKAKEENTKGLSNNILFCNSR